MEQKFFTEDKLKQSAQLAMDALVKVLVEEMKNAPEHVFSDEFNSKMSKLLK